jgi:hypothetical protein
MRDHILSFRLTKEQRERLDNLAERRGINVTDVVRSAVLDLLYPPISSLAPVSRTCSAPHNIIWREQRCA